MLLIVVGEREVDEGLVEACIGSVLSITDVTVCVEMKACTDTKAAPLAALIASLLLPTRSALTSVEYQ